MSKLSNKVTAVLFLLFSLTPQGLGQMEEILPAEPILFAKFKSFSEFHTYISNIVQIMFPKDHEQTTKSIRSFFEETLHIDILEASNLHSLGIATNREFGFGFNRIGQPFLVIPIHTKTPDERIVKLQNTLYKLDFSSFTFTDNYLISTGKDFEKGKNKTLRGGEYNLFISSTFLDSIVPFKHPSAFSNLYFLLKISNITTNRVSITISQYPIVLGKTNRSSRLENLPYTFQKDNASVIVNIELSPQDLLTNLISLERIVDLGIYRMLTNFEKETATDIKQIITNLVGPSSLFVYEYNNPLNNKIMFVSSVLDQNSLIRTIDALTREVAKKRDVFKFTIFDKSFYRLPIRENYNLYFGVIFNRFIVSSDRDIIVGFVRNIANNIKEIESGENAWMRVILNTYPTLNNTIRPPKTIHPFIQYIFPLIVQSKKIEINSEIVGTSITTTLNVEY